MLRVTILVVSALALFALCMVHAYGGALPTDRPVVLAYELDGRIRVQGTGWPSKVLNRVCGLAPSPSPAGDAVAYLYRGNVYVLRRDNSKVRQVTYAKPVYKDALDVESRISWHPSARWVAYTRPDLFRYDLKHKKLIEVPLGTKPPQGAVFLSTIWVANVSSGRCHRLLGPMGDYAALHRTGQIEGAQVHEPVFSPDGRQLWFLNAGALYRAQLDTDGLKAVGQPALVARLGSGLDFESPGVSKGGTGAKQIAWDGRGCRLVYWIGRFWGTGVSEYGYVHWSAGEFGKPVRWTPTFAAEIATAGVNIQGCAIDGDGHVWVYAYLESQRTFAWVRQDCARRLPEKAERPTWSIGADCCRMK